MININVYEILWFSAMFNLIDKNDLSVGSETRAFDYITLHHKCLFQLYYKQHKNFKQKNKTMLC